jgi:hypothetical protein
MSMLVMPSIMLTPFEMHGRNFQAEFCECDDVECKDGN